MKVCLVVNEVTKMSTIPGAQEHDEGLVDPAVLGRSPNRRLAADEADARRQTHGKSVATYRAAVNPVDYQSGLTEETVLY